LISHLSIVTSLSSLSAGASAKADCLPASSFKIGDLLL
jgi:hypothetical protein